MVVVGGWGGGLVVVEVVVVVAGGLNACTDQQLEAAAIEFSDPLVGKMLKITK